MITAAPVIAPRLIIADLGAPHLPPAKAEDLWQALTAGTKRPEQALHRGNVQAQRDDQRANRIVRLVMDRQKREKIDDHAAKRACNQR